MEEFGTVGGVVWGFRGWLLCMGVKKESERVTPKVCNVEKGLFFFLFLFFICKLDFVLAL